MKKTILLLTGLALFTFKNNAQTVTDYDGNVYNTVTIGSQVWMAENLKVTHYNNGVAIPNVTVNTAWSSLTTGGYCDYNNTPSNSTIYGKLYNWYAVNDIQNLAPIGWHIPTEAEWTTLTTYLGGVSFAGGKLKEVGTTHWQSPNTGATNETGFTALPGGYRYNYGTYNFLGSFGYWWTNTEYSTLNGWWYNTLYNSQVVQTNYLTKSYGFSVRCVKDATSGINEIDSKDFFQIYPNPAIDLVYINNTENYSVKMKIYNIIGECILQKELYNGINDININSLLKGIYIIKLSGANWTVNRQMTKL